MSEHIPTLIMISAGIPTALWFIRLPQYLIAKNVKRELYTSWEIESGLSSSQAWEIERMVNQRTKGWFYSCMDIMQIIILLPSFLAIAAGVGKVENDGEVSMSNVLSQTITVGFYCLCYLLLSFKN